MEGREEEKLIFKAGEKYLVVDAGDDDDLDREARVYEDDGTAITSKLKLQRILRFATGNESWEPVTGDAIPERLRRLLAD